jgi:hypothetical protein
MARTGLFSTYRAGENRVTGSMIAVFERIEPGVLERLLASVTGESTLEFVSFANQVGSSDAQGVPDAVISASFRYLFEVKTTRNAIRDSTQLDRHLTRLHSEGTYADRRLFVVTPDATEPPVIRDTQRPESVIWFSFRDLSTAIDDLLGDDAELLSDKTRFLLRELQELFVDDGLIGQDDVVIVAAREAYPEYLKYGLYVCQPNRSFRPGLTHMGFYLRRAIQREVPAVLHRIPKIELSPESVANLAASNDEADRDVALRLQRMLDDGVRQVGVAHGVVLVSLVEDPRTLVLDMPVAHPAGPAWTQQQRYTSASALSRQPKTTAELARD